MVNLKVRRAVRKRFDKKLDSQSFIEGTLGNYDGVVNVPGKPNYVYVQVGNRVIEVYNIRVQPGFGKQVSIGYSPDDPGKQQVLSIKSYQSEINGVDVDGPGYPPAIRYQWMANGGGQDPLFVHMRQMLPLRVSPYSGLTVRIQASLIKLEGVWTEFELTLVDLSSYVPTTAGKAILVLITIDTYGAVVVTPGTEMDTDALLDLSSAPPTPADTAYELVIIRLWNGQTVIREARTNTDIFDIRMFVLPFITPEFVGLGNVINAKQLTTGADDWSQFAAKNEPAQSDYLLIEDSESTSQYEKKRVLVSAIGGGTGGGGGIGSASMNWFIDGTIAVTQQVGPSFIVSGTGKISKVYAYIESSGTAGSTIIDVNLNGDTIFTTQANRPELDSDLYGDPVQTSATPDVVDVIAGDIITLDIDAVGTGAYSLSVMLTFVIPDPTSSGHVIQSNGEDMPARANMNFVGIQVTDDSANDATVIDLSPDVILPPSMRVWGNANFI